MASTDSKSVLRTATAALEMLCPWVEKRDYAGYDPYDALNSPVLRLLASRSRWLRMAFTQTLRRVPINVRPVFGIRTGHNPKALGLFLSGYSLLYRVCREASSLKSIHRLLSLLDQFRTDTASGHGWGYNFDWQNKVFWLPKFTPTIVNSAFIGHALLDCYESTGDSRPFELAVPVRDFILRDLNRIAKGAAFCFSYTPIDHFAVHDANLLGASFLVRIGFLTSHSAARETALTALKYSMGHQRQDGSWPYSEQQGCSWTDSFHTGFNLEAIRWFLKLGEADQYRRQWETGIRFYVSHFFLPDGTAKYYHDRIGPLDIHCPAQAIAFFSGEGAPYRETTECVLGWLLANFHHPEGYFRFRIGRYVTNNIPYMRWSQAWAFHALTRYIASVELS